MYWTSFSQLALDMETYSSAFMVTRAWKFLEGAAMRPVHRPMSGRMSLCTVYHIWHWECFILRSRVTKSRNAVLICQIYFYCPLPLINKYLLNILGDYKNTLCLALQIWYEKGKWTIFTAEIGHSIRMEHFYNLKYSNRS